MTLGEKQRLFPLLLVKLFNWMWDNGYEFTLGEAWRPPEMARIYASQGKGIEHSKHELRIAIDINLFKDGVYQVKTEQYQAVGHYWESLSGPGYQTVWGGRFKRQDGNHFELG